MKKNTFFKGILPIACIIIVVFVIIGAASIEGNAFDVKPEYLSLGNPVYNFTGAVQNTIGTFTYVGKIGNDLLTNLDILNAYNLRLYKLTVHYVDAIHEEDFYMLIWADYSNDGYPEMPNEMLDNSNWFYGQVYAYQNIPYDANLELALGNKYNYVQLPIGIKGTTSSKNGSLYRVFNITEQKVITAPLYTKGFKQEIGNIQIWQSENLTDNYSTYTYTKLELYDMKDFQNDNWIIADYS